MYVHQITFENGDSGDYSSKTKTCEKFKEGQESSYSIEFREFNGNRYAIIKPTQETSFKAAPKGGDESFALSYAKDLAVARIEKGVGGILLDDIIRDADKFYDWLKSKK